MDLVKNLIEFVTSFGDSTQGSPDESTAADVHYKSRKRKRNRVRSPSSGHARDDRVQSSPSRSLMSVPPATDQSTDRVQKRLRISDDQDDLTVSTIARFDWHLPDIRRSQIPRMKKAQAIAPSRLAHLASLCLQKLLQVEVIATTRLAFSVAASTSLPFSAVISRLTHP